MSFSTDFPEININQRHMLYRKLCQLIGDNEEVRALVYRYIYDDIIYVGKDSLNT